MVIGDDQVQSQASGGFSGGESANAAVHADDQPDSLLCGPGEDPGLHPVPVVNAVRQMEADLAPQHLNRGFQEYDRGGAIGVIVAIDQNLFALADRRLDAVYRLGHAAHGKGVQQILDVGREELPRLLRATHAALMETLCRTGKMTSAVCKGWHADARAGFYFLVRLGSAVVPAGAKFEVQVVAPDQPEPRQFAFSATAPAGEKVFELGLTGADWPGGEQSRPVAWRIALLTADGRVLAEQKSFLWENPAK